MQIPPFTAVFTVISCCVRVLPHIAAAIAIAIDVDIDIDVDLYVLMALQSGRIAIAQRSPRKLTTPSSAAIQLPPQGGSLAPTFHTLSTMVPVAIVVHSHSTQGAWAAVAAQGDHGAVPDRRLRPTRL